MTTNVLQAMEVVTEEADIFPSRVTLPVDQKPISLFFFFVRTG
jgi:hypothetical protein